MSLKWDVLGEEGLKFFGKICASISHEIKNALSIISENAGLLQDLTLMEEKGKAVEPGRFNQMAERVIHQVQRADSIVANLNSFAHSVDQDVKAVDLYEILCFVTLISGRMASMRGAALEPKAHGKPVTITTKPFLLENFLWLCINYVLDALGEEKVVGLTVERADSGGCIRISGLSDNTVKFPGAREEAFLEALGAEMTLEKGLGELKVALPDDISAGP